MATPVGAMVAAARPATAISAKTLDTLRRRDHRCREDARGAAFAISEGDGVISSLPEVTMRRV